MSANGFSPGLSGCNKLLNSVYQRAPKNDAFSGGIPLVFESFATKNCCIRSAYCRRQLSFASLKLFRQAPKRCHHCRHCNIYQTKHPDDQHPDTTIISLVPRPSCAPGEGLGTRSCMRVQITSKSCNVCTHAEPRCLESQADSVAHNDSEQLPCSGVNTMQSLDSTQSLFALVIPRIVNPRRRETGFRPSTDVTKCCH